MADRDKEIIGVVLLNLGGPDSLDAVVPFLYNLFSDRGIIKLGPSFMQKPIAWFISILRSSKTRNMYRLIGGKSPILDITMAQAKALERALNQSIELRDQNPDSKLQTLNSRLSFRVYVGMRYWHPYIKDAVQEILDDGIKCLIVLTMYPHYSKTTTGSAVAEFKKTISKLQITNYKLHIQYIEQWYDFPMYIEALAELIADGLLGFKGKEFELLYSAHSLPEVFIKEGDPYLSHIKATVELVNKKLSIYPYNFKELKWNLSFQSKTGPVRWLQPSTDKVIIELARSGSKNLFIVPISFVSDHIETLYEIDILYKGIAKKYGMNFKRCEALNTSEKFITALRELVMAKITDVK